jgi:hypothetical protein
MTILADLGEEDVSHFTPREKLFITEEHRQARLVFCRKWHDLTTKDWCVMFSFTDKSAMQVCPHGVQEVWRRVGDDAYVPAVLRPRF